MLTAGQFKSVLKCVTKPKSALNGALAVNAATQQLTTNGRDAVRDIIPALASINCRHKR
jgi:hypothetical protein